MKNNSINNVNAMLADLQSQLDQLKNKSDYNKPESSNIYKCTTVNTSFPDGMIFKKGDVVRVYGANVAMMPAGTETSTSSDFIGVVLIGNGDLATDEVYVQMSGIAYVKTATLTTIGMKLGLYSVDKRQVSSAGTTPFFVALESVSANSYVKVLITSSGGGRNVVSCPAKIVSKSGAFYLVNLFEDGIDMPATQSSVKAYILDLNFAQTLTAGDWVIVSYTALGITGGGNV